MKITSVTISKSVKQTRASRVNGLTNYDSVEPSVAYTVENPTDEDVKKLRQRVNDEVFRNLDVDPEWMKNNKKVGVQEKLKEV